MFLQLTNVSFSYGNNKILNNINVSIYEPSIIGIVAPNGTGKSTLLSIIDGTLSNFQGTVILHNLDFNKKNRHLIQRDIIRMPEQSELFPELTGMEHLKLYAALWKTESKIDSVVKQLDMTGYVHKKVKAYSLGMIQRLAFAMCLVTDAKLYLLDEVMNFLDPSNVQLVSQLLLDLAKEGKLILIVSHRLENLESIADSILFLQNKTIILEYFPQDSKMELLELIFHKELDLAQQYSFLKELGYEYARIEERTVRLYLENISDDKIQALFQRIQGSFHLFGGIRFGHKTCSVIYDELYG